MTSTTPRLITIILVMLGLATAPAAFAQPIRDVTGVQTSSLAGTTSPPMREDTGTDSSTRAGVPQDLRNPDQRVVPVAAPAIDKPAPVATDDDPSPFVYIIPSVALIAMLGAGLAYARTSRRIRVTV